MDNIWFGILIGLFVGTNVGIVVVALITASARGET